MGLQCDSYNFSPPLEPVSEIEFYFIRVPFAAKFPLRRAGWHMDINGKTDDDTVNGTDSQCDSYNFSPPLEPVFEI